MADRRYTNPRTGEINDDPEIRPFNEFIRVLRLGVKLAEPEAALEEAFSAIVGHVQAGVPVHINYGRG